MDIIEFNGKKETFDFSDFDAATEVINEVANIKLLILNAARDSVENFVEQCQLSHLSFELDGDKLNYFLDYLEIESDLNDDIPVFLFFAKENDVIYNLLFFVIDEGEECHFKMKMVKVKDGEALEMGENGEWFTFPPYPYLHGITNNLMEEVKYWRDLTESNKSGKDKIYHNFLDAYGLENNLPEKFEEVYRKYKKLFEFYGYYYPRLVLDWYREPDSSEEMVPCLLPNPDIALGFIITLEEDDYVLHNIVYLNNEKSPLCLTKISEKKFALIGKEDDFEEFDGIISWMLDCAEESGGKIIIPLSFNSVAIFNRKEKCWDFYCWNVKIDKFELKQEEEKAFHEFLEYLMSLEEK